MSGLAELSQRLAHIREISGIMTAMKSLALMETRKLDRFIGHQRRMLANIEAAAGDFLHFFPVEGAPAKATPILVLIGSERGFCGNFNERVLIAFDAGHTHQPDTALVVVGQRLDTKLTPHPGVFASLDGATVTEDVPAVLDRLMDVLHRTTGEFSGDGITFSALAHDAEGVLKYRRLLPLAPPPVPRLSHPPCLQLAPARFFAKLLDHYLLAALYGLLYESLAAENRQRLAHMEHALDRLDETLARLAVKRNALRQEKIVEEIEVILSSEQAFAEAG